MVVTQKVNVFLIEILIVRCVLSDGTYECGKNGRFEYCIDEFPGCIVGCHCHPGYYFDTDTKICEPNTKLIEHHRRHNIVEPTRAKTQISFTTDSYTTANPIDVEIGEISKDADNLGDWLYNQFFKTIENQVINSTNEDKPKRRSGGGSLSVKMPKQSKRKSNKTKFSKKKNNKKLKKKIKRISEDHSIFDDGSSSGSDSESDSSASSSSSDKSENSGSKEHEHKKIVVFQKKPKRPLPSFIFLPNMDTPYYPPLGLPPPPVMPMYPAVPVPPMVPVFPYPALTTCHGENKGEDKVTTKSSLPATSKMPDNLPDEPDTPNTPPTSKTTGATDASEASPGPPEGETEVTDKPPNDTEKTLRHRNKNKKKFPRLPGYQDRKLHTLGLRVNSLTPLARQKMLRQLKHKIKGASPNFLMPPWNNNVNKFLRKPKQQSVPEPVLEPGPEFLADPDPEPIPEIPVMQHNVLPEELALKNINPSQMQKDDPLTDNVSFKYISQLIHKENISNNFEVPPIEFNPNNFKDNKNMINFNIPYNTAGLRRKYNELENTNKDDTYFSKLGKQIASLIRGLDTNKQQINIEVEENKPTYAHSPYFNYNSPRSFWERSVRSPLNLANTQHSEFEYLKKSNEVLFNIENKVEIIASTSRPLNLQEMENIVNMMEMAKRNIVNTEKALNPLILDKTSKNLNVNLWPKELHGYNLNPTPVLETIHKNKQIFQDKPSIDGSLTNNNLKKILAWQQSTRPDKKHIGHILNSNNEPKILNNRFVNNQRESMRDKQIAFIRNAPTDQKLNAAMPNKRNSNIYLSRNKLTNIESIYLNIHPNSRKFYQQPSYFDREISQYDFYN